MKFGVFSVLHINSQSMQTIEFMFKWLSLKLFLPCLGLASQVSDCTPRLHFYKSPLRRLKLNCRGACVNDGGLSNVLVFSVENSFAVVISKPSVLGD